MGRFVWICFTRYNQYSRACFKPIRFRVRSGVEHLCKVLELHKSRNAACVIKQLARRVRKPSFSTFAVMDHFPTNWGRPVCISPFHFQWSSVDAPWLIFSETTLLTRTTHFHCTHVLSLKTLLRKVSNIHSEECFTFHSWPKVICSSMWQTTDCNWYLRASNQVQGWYYDGC